MRRYHVYMLQCADGSFYIGITNNLDLRVWQHNEGTDTHCYTYLRRPATLVYATEFADPNSAIAWEKRLKGWSRKKQQALVNGNWTKIKELSRRKDVLSAPFDSLRSLRVLRLRISLKAKCSAQDDKR